MTLRELKQARTRAEVKKYARKNSKLYVEKSERISTVGNATVTFDDNDNAVIIDGTP